MYKTFKKHTYHWSLFSLFLSPLILPHFPSPFSLISFNWLLRKSPFSLLFFFTHCFILVSTFCLSHSLKKTISFFLLCQFTDLPWMLTIIWRENAEWLWEITNNTFKIICMYCIINDYRCELLIKNIKHSICPTWIYFPLFNLFTSCFVFFCIFSVS